MAARHHGSPKRFQVPHPPPQHGQRAVKGGLWPGHTIPAGVREADHRWQLRTIGFGAGPWPRRGHQGHHRAARKDPVRLLGRATDQRTVGSAGGIPPRKPAGRVIQSHLRQFRQRGNRCSAEAGYAVLARERGASAQVLHFEEAELSRKHDRRTLRIRTRSAAVAIPRLAFQQRRLRRSLLRLSDEEGGRDRRGLRGTATTAARGDV